MTKTSTPTLARRTILAAAICAAALAATGAGAASSGPGLVDLKVVDRETGQEARVWRHDGRLYVAGRPGARYSLRITNNSAGRVLVVTSVDGVNVLTGQTAGYNQKGYVLRPYVSADVSGWRKSDTEVAAFHFAPLSRSYAARTGRPNDVGVIGIAVFTERYRAPVAVAPPPRPRYEGRYETYEEGATADARAYAPAAPPPVVAQSAPASRAPERLGTGHGAREWAPVSTVAFERASSEPSQVTRIEYDTRETLVARGVIPPRPEPRPRGPSPFPSENGYVPDPPRYR